MINYIGDINIDLKNHLDGLNFKSNINVNVVDYLKLRTQPLLVGKSYPTLIDTENLNQVKESIHVNNFRQWWESFLTLVDNLNEKNILIVSNVTEVNLGEVFFEGAKEHFSIREKLCDNKFIFYIDANLNFVEWNINQVPNPTFFMKMAQERYKDSFLPFTDRNKRMVFLVGSITPLRASIYREFFKNKNQDDVVTFNDWNGVRKLKDNEIKHEPILWARENLNRFGSVSIEGDDKHFPTIAKQALLNIVTESEYDYEQSYIENKRHEIFFTEKTWKAIAHKQIPLFCANDIEKHIEKFKDIGFRYPLEREYPITTYGGIMKFIDSILNNVVDVTDLYKEFESDIEYNYNLLMNTNWYDVFKHRLEANLVGYLND